MFDAIVERVDRVRAAFDEGLLNGVLAVLAAFNPFVLMYDAANGLFHYLTGWTFEDLAAGLIGFIGFDPFAVLTEAAETAFTYISGWSFDDVSRALRGAFDVDLLLPGRALLHGLWDGMVEAWPQIAAWAADLAANLSDTIGAGAVAVRDAGAALIQSLWDGAVATFTGFLDWIRDIPRRIVEAIGNIDLSGAIRWPSMPSWMGGGSAPAPTPEQTETLGRAEASGWTRPQGSRAIGGPVRPGFVYEINEEGREFFMPGSAGRVIPAGALAAVEQAGRGGLEWLQSLIEPGEAPGARPLTQSLALDMRGAGQRGGGLSVGDIHIHAAPGMDPRAIAEQVRRVLRDEARSAGYALHDGGFHAT